MNHDDLKWRCLIEKCTQRHATVFLAETQNVSAFAFQLSAILVLSSVASAAVTNYTFCGFLENYVSKFKIYEHI